MTIQFQKEVYALSDLFHVSAAPHTRSPITTSNIMRDVAIALVPASLFGIYNFGLRALLVILVTIIACMATEYYYCKGMKRKISIGDYSAVVTGLLLALNLPASIPLWIAALGGVFAILVVKMVFGGLGQNFMNPALAARAFLLISFPARMAASAFQVEHVDGSGLVNLMKHGAMAVDGMSGATPLAELKAGNSVDLLKLFIGNVGGTIGETSALAIIIGAAYLIIRKVISLRIPFTYIISFAIFVLLFGGNGFDLEFVLSHILGGGLLLGAFFMATDYVTSPASHTGQIVFGIILGLLTGSFRILGGSVEGVSYAIIFSNLLVPLIDKLTVPNYFGKERADNGK